MPHWLKRFSGRSTDEPDQADALPSSPDALAELEERSAAMQARLTPTLWSRALSLIVASVFAYMTVGGVVGGSLSWQMALVFAVLGALGGIHFLGRAFGRHAPLEWDENGLVDRTSIFSGPLEVGWGQIRRIRPTRRGNVAIELEEASGIRENMSLLRRVELALNRLRGFNGFNIGVSFLRTEYRQLADVLSDEAEAFEIRRLRLDRSIEDGSEERQQLVTDAKIEPDP